MEDKISESLGLTPIQEIRNGEVLDAEDETTEISENVESESVEDYSYARDNIREIIEAGKGSLDMLAQLAEQAENPKAYDALAGFMKTLLEANKELVNLDKAKSERFKNQETQSVTNNTTNVVMAGTTKDLKALVEQMRSRDEQEND